MTVETRCPDPDEPGEVLYFSVCKNCDYGINEHTEGECACIPVPLSLDEVVARARNSSLTDPTWRTDYRWKTE